VKEANFSILTKGLFNEVFFQVFHAKLKNRRPVFSQNCINYARVLGLADKGYFIFCVGGLIEA